MKNNTDTTSLTKIIMNPVRQRILQYLIIHEKGSTGEIQNALSDVPTASLYRHIKKLLDGNCIYVAEEKRVRGTVEKIYGLVRNPLAEEPTMQDISSMFYTSLLSLQTSFLQYFEKENVDPQKDMLALQSATLMLSDEEYMDFLLKLNELVSETAKKEPDGTRKPRRFTFISSPNEEMKGE